MDIIERLREMRGPNAWMKRYKIKFAYTSYYDGKPVDEVHDYHYVKAANILEALLIVEEKLPYEKVRIVELSWEKE